MADTIAVLSLKGGTGKTTTVRTLADVLRRVGLDVLTIDLDPQGNLSDYFDVPPDAAPTIADVLSGDVKVKAAAHDGIVPATPILAEVERSLSGKMGRELVLKKALKDARKQHDVILIDCPPALGLLTVNGLVAADWALISTEAQYFALQGVNGALEVIEQAREYYNPDLEFLGVLMNIADMRTTHSRAAYSQLREAFGVKVFDTVIRASIAYAESAEKALSILEYRPDLGADYLALADEVLSRIGREDVRGAWPQCSARTATRSEGFPDGRLQCATRSQGFPDGTTLSARHGDPRLPLRRLGGVHAPRGLLAGRVRRHRARRRGAHRRRGTRRAARGPAGRDPARHARSPG